MQSFTNLGSVDKFVKNISGTTIEIGFTLLSLNLEETVKPCSMELHSDEYNNFSLTRFESMLKTNNVLFFDSEEFEDIVHHYLENGKLALAKKATKLGLEQHPTSTNLKLFQIEMYIFEDKLELAEELLNDLHLLEQSNEE